MSSSNISSIPLSLATVSIGCKPEHTLPKKIASISEAGFNGLELGMPDLISFASDHLHKSVKADDFDDLAGAARVVKAMCQARNVEIMLLQPFANFEGWSPGSGERVNAWDRVEGWIKIMKACECITLQVGCSDTPPEHSAWNGDRKLIVDDLRQLGQRLAQDSLRVAYENWCWGHAPDWQDVWSIVEEVALDNVGLCLDSFQTCGGEWANPTTESGLRSEVPKEELDRVFQESMDLLEKTIPAGKIYVMQISDAYKVQIPDELDQDGLRPRGQWSKKYRPAPLNGGYLPIAIMIKAVLTTGFRGWYSCEVFDQGPDGRGKDYELDEFARDCMHSTREIIRQCTPTDV